MANWFAAYNTTDENFQWLNLDQAERVSVGIGRTSLDPSGDAYKVYVTFSDRNYALPASFASRDDAVEAMESLVNLAEQLDELRFRIPHVSGK